MNVLPEGLRPFRSRGENKKPIEAFASMGFVGLEIVEDPTAQRVLSNLSGCFAWPLGLGILLAFNKVKQNRRCDKNRAVGTNQDTDEQAICETMDPFTAEDVHQQDRNDGCRRCQQGSAQGLGHALIDHLLCQSWTLTLHFSNSVKHDDRVVERIANDRQECGYDRQRNLEVLDQQEPKRFEEPVADATKHNVMSTS